MIMWFFCVAEFRCNGAKHNFFRSCNGFQKFTHDNYYPSLFPLFNYFLNGCKIIMSSFSEFDLGKVVLNTKN